MKKLLSLSLIVFGLSTLTAQATTPVPEQEQKVVFTESKTNVLVDLKITNVVATDELNVCVNTEVVKTFSATAVSVKEKPVLFFEPYKDVGWRQSLNYNYITLTFDKERTSPGKLNQKEFFRIRADT